MDLQMQNNALIQLASRPGYTTLMTSYQVAEKSLSWQELTWSSLLGAS